VTGVLLIGGVDSSGGAGLTRDARTLARFATEALCAVTAVTAQSDAEVTAVHHVPPDIVRAQIAAAFDTRRVAAIKLGMLGTRATVLAVAAGLAGRARLPLVLDPVRASTSGAELLDAAGQAALRELLLPRATVVTPNIPEAAALLGEALACTEPQLLRQAQALLALGPEAVLLKGGHAAAAEATDLLLMRGRPVQRLCAPRIGTTRRGTGCALASAIAAGLAAGLELTAACAAAKEYVTGYLRSGD
jgi:hydroxymethylpyrimidine/phosphomethylpyrimidine kinase